MKTTAFLATSIASLAVVGMATAEPSIEAAATLGYSSGEANLGPISQDVNTVSLNFASTIKPAENFEFDFDIDMRGVDLSGTPAEAQVLGFAIAPRYTMPNGLIMGGFFEYTATDASPAVPSFATPSRQTLGVSLGMERENWDAEGFVSRTELKPITNPLPLDIRSLGIRGSYDLTDRFTVGGHLLRSEVTGPIPSLQAYSIGGAFFYDINNNISVFAGISHQWADEFGINVELTTPSIGVSYAQDFVGSGRPVIYSLEYAQTDLSVSGLGPVPNTDFQEIRIGMTIPLGSATSSRPLNSNAYNIIDGSHDVTAAIFNF